MCCKACVKPMVVVDFPSPAGVGVIAVTNTSFPFGLCCKRSIASQETFALYFPYSSNSSSESWHPLAISTIGFISAC